MKVRLYICEAGKDGDEVKTGDGSYSYAQTVAKALGGIITIEAGDDAVVIDEKDNTKAYVKNRVTEQIKPWLIFPVESRKSKEKEMNKFEKERKEIEEEIEQDKQNKLLINKH
jgi:hypothetical protein